jgi:hypothetical protein
MKGLARRNTRVKYESPSTYQSKVIILLMDGRTDRQTDIQSDYYRALAISGALIKRSHHEEHTYEIWKPYH